MPIVRNIQAASVHGLTQRAQAASMRPSISAAMAKENAIEKPTCGPVSDLLERQQQRGKRRLHETGERMVAPPHHQHIVRDSDATLAQRAVQAEGIVIVSHHECVWPATPIKKIACDPKGVVGLP